MAGSLLDIYNKYSQAVNAYNTAGTNWNNAVAAYNDSIISDKGQYSPQTGNLYY